MAPDLSFAERDGIYTVAGIRGVDAAGETAEPEEQLNHAFENLAAALERRDLSTDSVGRVVVVLADAAHRPFINPPWLKLFSDEDRPARRTINAPLPAGVAVELEATGVRGQKRSAVEIAGLSHADPLPMGASVGNLLLSSAIGSQSPSGSHPEGVAAIRQAFDNLTAFVQAAGGTLDSIANVSVYLGRWDLHDDMVDTWVGTFADEDSRPTRKTYYYPSVDIQLQCEAILGDRVRRANFEIDGIGHHDPIPMAAVTGGLFTTSGVDGRDPASGRAPRGVRAQAEQAIANLRFLVAHAGTSTAGLQHVTALVGQTRYRDEMAGAWADAWAGESAVPSFSMLELGLPAREFLVQVVGRGYVAEQAR